MCDSDRARRLHGRARTILLVCATFATALLFGCMPYELRSVLDGPQGKALSVSPSATVVIAGSAISLKAVGGVKPYVYALVSGSSTGTLNTSTGVFTSTSAGSAVIRVTDKTGKSVDAKITIQPVATGLQISPLSITLSVGASITFVPIGGSTPYSFLITTNNSGATMIGAVYTAGPTPADDVVTLTDGASTTVTAAVHVVPMSTVNYAITGTAFSGTGTVSTALPGGQSFTLENIGSTTGTSADWKVYLSANSSLDGGDFVIASGTVNNLSASGSVNPSVTGTFPAVAPSPPDYYLIVQVTSADDTTPGNNTSAAPITMNPKNIDYAVGTVSNIVGLIAGAGMTGDFTIENQGTANGSATVFWQVRASADLTLEPTDYIVAGGNIPGGLSSGVPTSVPFSGTWPSTPGTWHLFEIAVSVDDINNVNDVTNPPTSVITTGAAPANVKYTVTSVSNGPGIVAGDPISATFTLRNNGTDGGTQPVYWTAYVSVDSTLQLGTDTVIDSGTETVPLGPTPDQRSVPFTGTWPSTPGPWHLIVSISSSDDIDTTDNVTPSVLITTVAPSVNYQVNLVSHTTGTIAGGPFSGTVEIQNIGVHAGTQVVLWRVYVSTDAALQIGTDVLVATGSIPSPGLTAGDSDTPTFSGTWPSSPVGRLYYLIVEVAAGDDVASGNNIGATLTTIAVAGVAPDYTITAVPLPSGATASQPVNGTFTVLNGGNGPGAGVSWQVYASLGNSSYDAGDTLLATGSTLPIAMSSSASPVPAYAGTWPAAAGNYYIVVRLSAADDASIADGASGLIIVNSPPKPDYTAVFNVTPTGIPWSGLVGTAINPAVASWLTIQNMNANLGHANVAWAVYLSLDNVLDTGDILVQQGSVGPLAGSGSTPVTFVGNWPAAPGQLYFMIATVQAMDDANITNDVVIARHPCAIGDYQYVEGGESNNGNGTNPPVAQTSNTGVTGAFTLGADQTIAIEGAMDAYVGPNSQYDTYLFSTDATMSRLSIRSMWGTGFDDVDLYLWDTGTTNLKSINVGIDSEPGASNFDVTSVTPRDCYISANSWLAANTSGNAGQKYVILVRGLAP